MSEGEQQFVRARELLSADLGDELVALDVQDGLCFAFNEVATLVWQRLAEPVAVDALVGEFTADFDVPADDCRRDLLLLLDRLRSHRLIRAI